MQTARVAGRIHSAPAALALDRRHLAKRRPEELAGDLADRRRRRERRAELPSGRWSRRGAAQTLPLSAARLNRGRGSSTPAQRWPPLAGGGPSAAEGEPSTRPSGVSAPLRRRWPSTGAQGAAAQDIAGDRADAHFAGVRVANARGERRRHPKGLQQVAAGGAPMPPRRRPWSIHAMDRSALQRRSPTFAEEDRRGPRRGRCRCAPCRGRRRQEGDHIRRNRDATQAAPTPAATAPHLR